MTDKTGGAAFPASGHPGKQHLSQEGMTLRDYFAAKAMQGDWVAQPQDGHFFPVNTTEDALDKVAALYYRMADAMLRAREK
ncbi:hypothetical protein [Morganella morganii]|uniref:hypothetical protein n=1 Tax=Morganella morganii TaxID=582 RepID=UPI001BD98814|nr:hypothetical protein [Morganella morganii]MBT0494073.1 hypothetical protein [Morganella morganii subsp. morganii]QWL95236.1 hypothetical protein IZ186_06145 [Morganella morganii subsp. morganii]